ncbi:hypothetical protein UY3_00592 [Chelonia mydas]|uniref:Uncharacterized protein n=1 Tax=Chelonia mydas TaxID=8469 RepID=M7BYA3_CHEMY|nr:hypothetical protein UY3_00592 [Chelonia mydas]
MLSAASSACSALAPRNETKNSWHQHGGEHKTSGGQRVQRYEETGARGLAKERVQLSVQMLSADYTVPGKGKEMA